jgi:hypothetical protein
MRLKREPGSLQFSFNQSEARLLIAVLTNLAGNYRVKPDQLDPKLAAAWYSERGCAAAGLSSGETKEWLDNLHALKTSSLQLLDQWLGQLSESKPGSPVRLVVLRDDAPIFMRSINDSRLMAASRHEIGQTEMDIHSPFELLRLPAERQVAMMEIHFLAWILEETLRALDAA